jgi:hypothetical protein
MAQLILKYGVLYLITTEIPIVSRMLQVAHVKRPGILRYDDGTNDRQR